MLAAACEAPARRDPEEIAVAALAFIAWRVDELSEFLFATGLERSTIREAARTPQFLAGVLDYVEADPERLHRVARGIRASVAEVDLARRALLPSARVAHSIGDDAFGPGPLTLRCEHCRREKQLDRRRWPYVPGSVSTILAARCGPCGGSLHGPETWLDASGNEVVAYT